MKERLLLVLFPPAEVGRASTGLTFTDILFGLVISELFLRIQNWLQIPSYIRGHLIVGLALVLGSWIGFRRSLHRTVYELKFFNIPLFRFLMDQAMVLLYFRMAVLTPLKNPETVSPEQLVGSTIAILVFVFLLYLSWDAFGVWMAKAKVRNGSSRKVPKYPKVVEDEPTDEPQAPNWVGLFITLGWLVGFIALWWAVEELRPEVDAVSFFVPAAVLLLVYRWAKELRTSWHSR
jgi:hypothetical protein